MADTPITKLRNLMTPMVNYLSLMNQFGCINGNTFAQADLKKAIENMPEIRKILSQIPDDACDIKKQKND